MLLTNSAKRRKKSRVQEHIMSIYYCWCRSKLFLTFIANVRRLFLCQMATHTRGALSNLNKYIKTTTHLHSFPCVQSACVWDLFFLTTLFFTTQQFCEGWKSAFVPLVICPQLGWNISSRWSIDLTVSWHKRGYTRRLQNSFWTMGQGVLFGAN